MRLWGTFIDEIIGDKVKVKSCHCKHSLFPRDVNDKKGVFLPQVENFALVRKNPDVLNKRIDLIGYEVLKDQS